MDEYDEAAHGDVSNTLINEACGYMIVEDHYEQEYIDNTDFDKYIGTEVMMDVPGEGPRRSEVKSCVGYLDGSKLGTYHWKPLMGIQEYELEYDYGTHDWYFDNIISENIYSQVN